MRSSKDAPAHTKLKYRVGHQQVLDKKAQLRESLRKLEEAEKKAKKIGKIGNREVNREEDIRGEVKLLKQEKEVDVLNIKSKYDDDSSDDDGGDLAGGISGDEEDENINGSDFDSDSDGDDDSDGFDDSDSEDEEAALQAELAKIRKEREEAKRKQEEREREEEEAKLAEVAQTGNPLLNSNGGGGKLKRKWNDDVVFRNQSRTEPDSQKKRFINDTVRNDFHKRFMDRYVR